MHFIWIVHYWQQSSISPFQILGKITIMFEGLSVLACPSIWARQMPRCLFCVESVDSTNNKLMSVVLAMTVRGLYVYTTFFKRSTFWYLFLCRSFGGVQALREIRRIHPLPCPPRARKTNQLPVIGFGPKGSKLEILWHLRISTPWRSWSMGLYR